MDTNIQAAGAIPVPARGRSLNPITIIKAHPKALALIAVVLIVGALAFVWWSRKDSGAEYVTDKVTRGSVEVDVSATGTLQAVTTVLVGSQVSGSVAWLGADFKSQVKRGQIIAKLDPALFQAQIDTARANLMNAQAGVQAALTEIGNQQANVEAAKANDAATKAQRDDAIEIAKQNAKLKGIIPDREIEASQNAAKAAIARVSQSTSQIGQATAQMEISRSKLKQAQAAVKQSEAQLEQANVNFQHSIIESPIDGVVVSRSVDVGQTVAASLSAPTLFTIANDLTNMQVLASIDEADVGQVKEGIQSHFTVDAFPGQTFSGEITQVRLNAQTLQNVVTYQAVITVSNPELKLMPGMTANITIPVARRDDVLRIPNASLRFKPDLTEQQQKDVQAKIDAFRQQPQSQAGNEGDQQKGNSQGAESTDQKADNSNADAGARPRGNGNRNSAKQPADGAKASSNTGADGGKRRHQASESGGKSTGQPDNANANSAGATPPRKHRQQGDQTATDSKQGKGGKDKAAKGDGKDTHPGDQAKSDGAKGKPSASPSPSATQAANQGGAGSGRRGGGAQRQIVAVWVLTATKTLEVRIIRTGITDGRFTEVIAGDLKEGDVIIIGLSDASSSTNRTPQATTPFQQRPPGAGGGRGR
jgi:HlyD family secretion protein